MFTLLPTRSAFPGQQPSGLNVAATERSHVFVEIPPLIAEQATRPRCGCQRKQSFVLKFKKHGATNRIGSEPIRRAIVNVGRMRRPADGTIERLRRSRCADGAVPAYASGWVMTTPPAS